MERGEAVLFPFPGCGPLKSIEKATPQLFAQSARGRAPNLKKQVAPTLSIFAGDVRPFAGQTINVFAEESLASSAKADKASWADSSNLLFNWVVRLRGKAGHWRQLLGGSSQAAAARAESGFGGGEAYQNTKHLLLLLRVKSSLFQSAGTGRLDGSLGSRQQLLVFFSTAVTNQDPHV